MTPELGPNRGVPLLVTSKHVLQHQRLGSPVGTLEYFDKVTVTANGRNLNTDGLVHHPDTCICKGPRVFGLLHRR